MKTLNLNYPTTPRIQSSVNGDNRATFNEVFHNVHVQVKRKYKPNFFKPQSFRFKRTLKYWRNQEQQKDPDCISGRFNEEHYEQVKQSRQ
jgi:ribosomal protein L32E